MLNKKFVIYEENNWIKWTKAVLTENVRTIDIGENFDDISEDEIVEMGLKPTAVNRPIFDEDDNKIGFNFLVDPSKGTEKDPTKQGPRVAVIFSCDFENFQNQHPDLIKKLHEEFGNIRWVNKTCPGNARPRVDLDKKNMYNKVDGYEDKDEIEKIHDIPVNRKPSEETDTEKIKRNGLNEVLRDFFGSKDERFGMTESGEELGKILKDKTIPPIQIDNKKNVDISEVDNDHVKIKTHSYYFIKDPKEFFKLIMGNTKGNGNYENVSVGYLPKRNGAWNNTKKGSKQAKGLTPVYGLNKQGYEQEDYTVFVEVELTIFGSRGESDFTWGVQMDYKIGRKVPGTSEMKRDDIKPVSEYHINFTNDYPVTKGRMGNAVKLNEDSSVMEGLMTTLNEFKTKVSDLNGKSLLSYAKVMRSNVGVEN